MKRTALLFLSFIPFFISHLTYSQNEIRYSRDTTFLKELRPIYDDMTDYEVLNLWVDRATKMASTQSYYDFDIALRNYKLVASSKLDRDSMELYTNRLFNLMCSVEGNEYKILLAHQLKSVHFNLFKTGKESLKWNINGIAYSLNSQIVDSIDSFIKQLIQSPLNDLLKYHFPRESAEQSFADYFLQNNYVGKPSETNTVLLNELISYYKRNGFWEEYQNLYEYYWAFTNDRDHSIRLAFIKENRDYEYLFATNLMTLFKKIYGNKKGWMKLDKGYREELLTLIDDFQTLFPNSVFQNNIALFKEFVKAPIVRSDVLYHAYNSPTIVEVNSLNCDSLYYYYFAGHDSRSDIGSSNNKTLVHSGVWKIDSNRNVFAIPEAEGVNNYLLISEKEVTDFSDFKDFHVLNVELPYEANVHAWNEIPYAIKLAKEDYVNYLVVQDLKTGKPIVNVPVYNGQGIKVNQTNKQGIATYLLKDSLHYMIHHLDTFSVDISKRRIEWYKEPLIDFEKIGEWFYRFERYPRDERMENTEFTGFTDRTRYRPGDTVFYKAYAFLEDDWRSNSSDKRLNYYLKKVEVVLKDGEKNVIAKDSVSINRFHAVDGYFVLPEDLKLGSYKIELNDNWNYLSCLSFDVEDYIDEKYIIKLGQIHELYEIGDTVEFIVHIESRTGERFPGVKIVVEGDSVITREGIADHNGAFVVRTKVVKDWRSVVVKGYLPTGEVLSERKSIIGREKKYKLKRSFTSVDTRVIKFFNNDDALQKDTTYHLLLNHPVSESKYSLLDGVVHFSKEDFKKWYPLAVTSRDSFIYLKTIHSRDTLFDGDIPSHDNLFASIDGDTINISKELYSRFQYDDDLISIKVNRKNNGKKRKVYSDHEYLTYLLRKKNGNFKSKTIVFKDGFNSFLSKKVTKGKFFELISNDGDIRVSDLQFNKISKIKSREIHIAWDSVPYEMFPNQEYTVSFQVKKGKRPVKSDVVLFLVKEEHVNRTAFPSKTPKYFIQSSRNGYNRTYNSSWRDLEFRYHNKNEIYKVDKHIQLKEYYYTVNKDGTIRKAELMKLDKHTHLSDVIIPSYRYALISKDAGASGVSVSYYGQEDISKLPVRSVDVFVRTVAGVNDMGGLSIRGSRTDGDYYYIDGVKVRGSANLPMNALEEVEIVTGGLPTSFGDADLAMEETEGKLLSFDQIRERTRFGDTQFFIPNVKRKGKHYQVTFTQNDEITAWNLMAVAGTRNYKYAQGNQRLISVQPVQLVENTPRFLRVGDTVFLSANVFNLTNDSLVLQPSLNFYHSVSNENMNVSFGVNPLDKITVGPQQTKEVTWKVVVPTYFLQTVNMEMAVAGKQFGDRFTKSIPVLQRKGIYEVGQSFVKMEGDTLQLVLDQNTFLSETAEVLDAHFYLNGNKEIEYLITRGKELKEVSLLTSPQIARHWALIAELHELVAAKPALKTLLDREYAATLDSIGAHANETFKVLELTNRLFVIMQLQELIPQEAYASTAKKLKEELFKFQDEEGKYRWLQASEKASNWATSSVIHYLAKVKSYGFEVDSMLYAGWAKDLEVQFALYLKDRKVNWWNWHFYRDLDNYVLLKDNWSIDFKQVWECIKDQYWKSASTTAQLYFAQLALNTKDDALAKQIAKSILNVTSYSKNKGRFIAKQERGSELQNQAELIFLLEKLGGYNKEIVQLQQYMRIHQDYNTWSNNKQASHYLRALICGDSQEALLNKNVRVTVNGKTTEVELTKNQEIEIVPDQKQWDISIVSHPELVVTGGLKVKMMDEMDNVKRSTDDRLRLERLIYFKKGESWIHAQEGTEIPLGSTIRMDLVLTAANDFSYLQVDMPRITGLEFKDKTSGYRWGRVRHYAEYRNDVLRLYIDRIREGQTTLSFEGVVTNAGTFLFAPSSVTSEKNSEIGATDKAMKVKVKK